MEMELSLFHPDPNLPGITYTFRCPESTVRDLIKGPEHFFSLRFQVDHEFSLLEEIQTSVERIYKDGRPLHHLPSARSKVYTPDVSSIFVVDAAEFMKMSAHEIQGIFRHRHILVLDVPTEHMEFDLEALSTLGSMLLPRHGQGK